MKSHRGLASVIGAVFLIAIVIGALSYITYSLEIMGNFSESLIAEESRFKDKQREAFDITSIDITGANKLDAVIKNTGQIPLKITTLWLDKQNENDVVQKIFIDKTIAPGKSFNLIDENIDIDIDPTAAYSMKFITSRGETRISYLHSVADQPVDIQVVAIPDVIPTAFSSTIMMIVVNNMTDNNSLLNLTPVEPACGSGCVKLSGPVPATYDSLDPGDIAIFRWSYQLTGDPDTVFTFTSSLVGGVPENSASDDVVIGEILEAVLAGQSLSAIGFGGQDAAQGGFVFHVEDHNIPDGADYQMKLNSPDNNPGTFVPFAAIGDRLQFFSANASGNDVHIPAGIWNASLRYNSDRLPSGMAHPGADNLWDGTGEGGITYHFNDISPASGLYDSGTDPTCTALASSNGAGVFGDLSSNYDVTGGVNGTGAYVFDGTDDYIIIDNGGKDTCTASDKTFLSTTLWFKGEERVDKEVTQTLFANMDLDGNNVGGIYVEVGDGTANNHGQVFFTVKDKDLDTVICESDRPDGDSGPNYLDGEWHHFAATNYASGKCKLWIDGNEKDDDSNGSMTNHLHNYETQLYLGSKVDGSDDFKGTIDDLMYWNDYVFTDADVTALHEFSYGDNVHSMNFFISNATGVGDTVYPILKTSLNYMLPWSDPGSGTNAATDSAGGNYTTGIMPLVTMKMDTDNRLNFTMSYASGEPLNLLVDDGQFTGTGSAQLSSYLQVPNPPAPEKLPTYSEFSRALNKVEIFVYNAGSEGAWLTYQGTRVVFNGTNGNYAGLAHSMDDGTGIVVLSSDQDGPFIPALGASDIDFWHPKTAPSVGNPQGPSERIPAGFYEVHIFLNGYDESGAIIVRSINMGNVEVTE